MRDLHTLTRTLGLNAVAEALGVTARALRGYRTGERALTVDHLLRLSEAYPDFDAQGTIREVGLRRRYHKRARTFRGARLPAERA